jgi:hypothetical protein
MLKETEYYLEIRSVGQDSENNLHKQVSKVLKLFNRNKIYHRHVSYLCSIITIRSPRVFLL